MPRIRTIKPEAFQHRKVGRLSDRALRLWLAMLSQADDEGRLVADAMWLRIVVFGYHPGVTEADVEATLGEIAAVALVRLYTVDGVRYLDFPSWHDHQRIDRPQPSRLPPPPGVTPGRAFVERSSRRRRVLGECSTGIGTIGSDRNGSERSEGSGVSRSAPPLDAGAETVHPQEAVDPAPARTDPHRRRPGAARATQPIEAASLPVGNSEARSQAGVEPGAGRPVTFRMPASIAEALDRAPVLGAVERLREPAWWQAQVRANPGVDFAAEILRAEAWFRSNPGRAPKSHHARFLHAWLARADRPREED